MNNYDLLERLQRRLNGTTTDIKAEAQLLLALEEGLAYEDFVAHCDSFFFREYSKDVLYSEVNEDAARQTFLQLHLTRSGISDALPEGLFFQPQPSTARAYGATEMAEEYRLNKKKEADIRRFFLPFENEFFHQRVQLEAEETKLLQGLESGILADYFIRFWNLSSSIPARFITPLILLLPYAGKIAGHLSLTAKCLQLLLGEPVNLKKIAAPLTGAPVFDNNKLGRQQLGIDAVCGESFAEDYPVLECTIGPVQNSAVPDYLEGGSRFVLLQAFYSFFVPAGVEVVTVVEVAPGHKNMVLASAAEPVLGYSTVL